MVGQGQVWEDRCGRKVSSSDVSEEGVGAGRLLGSAEHLSGWKCFPGKRSPGGTGLSGELARCAMC